MAMQAKSMLVRRQSRKSETKASLFRDGSLSPSLAESSGRASVGSFCAFAEEQAAAFRTANPLPYFTRVGNKFERRKMREWSDTHFTACRLRTTDMLLDAAMEAEVERVAERLARAREHYLKETQAATKIQSIVRGRQGRKRAEAVRVQKVREQGAAVLIQRVARGRQARLIVAKLRRGASLQSTASQGSRMLKPKGDAVKKKKKDAAGRSRSGSILSPKASTQADDGMSAPPSPSSPSRSPKGISRRKSRRSLGELDVPVSPGGRGADGADKKASLRSKSQGNLEQVAKLRRSADDCGRRLLQALEANPKALRCVQSSLQGDLPLARLQLEHVILGAAGCISLAKALLGSSSLVILELKGNYAGCAGAQRLVAALEECPRLARLGLAWNCIGDAGGARVADAAGRMPALKDLDLSYNRITDIAAPNFVEAMQSVSCLQQLDLRSNQFTAIAEGPLRDACAEKVLLHLEGEPKALEVKIQKESSSKSSKEQISRDRSQGRLKKNVSTRSAGRRLNSKSTTGGRSGSKSPARAGSKSPAGGRSGSPSRRR